MANTITKKQDKEIKTPYYNGKTSDHPIIQEMIRLDNEVFHVA